jgi:hypothetical protein
MSERRDFIAYRVRMFREKRAPRGLGDLVETAAKPIAKALKLDCLDSSGNLKPESGCAKRKAALNRIKL